MEPEKICHVGGPLFGQFAGFLTVEVESGQLMFDFKPSKEYPHLVGKNFRYRLIANTRSSIKREIPEARFIF
ncbi:hypothetical protein [Sphaerothrix gracilis]|uniref:hypothetical protein n=1 Tax=Sphaerothrix gracilis TaxID=3151835 RepID=UPI0031FC59F3